MQFVHLILTQFDRICLHFCLPSPCTVFSFVPVFVCVKILVITSLVYFLRLTYVCLLICAARFVVQTNEWKLVENRWMDQHVEKRNRAWKWTSAENRTEKITGILMCEFECAWWMIKKISQWKIGKHSHEEFKVRRKVVAKKIEFITPNDG